MTCVGVGHGHVDMPSIRSVGANRESYIVVENVWHICIHW